MKENYFAPEKNICFYQFTLLSCASVLGFWYRKEQEGFACSKLERDKQSIYSIKACAALGVLGCPEVSLRLLAGQVASFSPVFQQTLTNFFSSSSFVNSNTPHVHAFGMWEKARAPRLRKSTQMLMPVRDNELGSCGSAVAEKKKK